MTIYTIIAYRENGLDTCRGCEMGRSDSEFDYIATEDIKKAAAFCADKHHLNSTYDREYRCWELTYLIDGMDENLWWEQNQDHYGDTPFRELDTAIEADEKTLLIQRLAEQKRIDAERELKRKQAEAERARLWQEQQERNEFARLSKKFGTT